MPSFHVRTDHSGIRLVMGIIGMHGVIAAAALLYLAAVQVPCTPHAVDCWNLAPLMRALGIPIGLVGVMLVVTALWAEFRSG